VPESQSPRATRETRILLVTIAVAIAALLLLARFRFPEQTTAVAHPTPAPLERLAARAAYDELASTMADLERRLEARVAILRVAPPRMTGAYVVAPRVSSGRAVTLLAAGETLYATGTTPVDLISWDASTGVAVVAAATAADQLVTPRVGAPRSDPRYIATLEPTELGPLVRPVYIGRTTVATEPRTSTPLYALHALQYPVSRGTPIFTLDGVFLGLVAESGTTTSVITGEFLRTMAESASRASRPMPAVLGLQVQDASATVLRAAGADRGVVVTHVEAGGAADGLVQPGDIIHAVDGVATTVPAEFRHVELTSRPGERVTLDLVRRGKPEQVVMVAGSGDRSPDDTAGDLGLVGQTIPDAGIEVVTVPLHGAAARAGLRRGDLIVTVNGQPVRDLSTLTKAYQALAPKTSALISVQRDDQHLVLALEKP
jgi:hypothetical protein